MQTQNAAVAAIQFALETDDGLAFLRCWNEGNFDTIRREWPEAQRRCSLELIRFTLRHPFDLGKL